MRWAQAWPGSLVSRRVSGFWSPLDFAPLDFAPLDFALGWLGRLGRRDRRVSKNVIGLGFISKGNLNNPGSDLFSRFASGIVAFRDANAIAGQATRATPSALEAYLHRLRDSRSRYFNPNHARFI